MKSTFILLLTWVLLVGLCDKLGAADPAEAGKCERLWPADPVGYFACMTNAVSVSDHTLTNDQVRLEAFGTLLDRIVQKPCPQDLSDALSCFNLKYAGAFNCSNASGVDQTQQGIIDFAKILGEIRSRRLPGYPHLTSMHPNGIEELLSGVNVMSFNGVVPDPNSLPPDIRKKYEKLWDDQRHEFMINNLQNILKRLDDSFTPKFIRMCSRFPSSDPKNSEFIKQVVQFAKLTEDEQKRLF